MRRIDRIINGEKVSLIDLSVYDEDDIKTLINLKAEKNFNVSLNMLGYLDYFKEAEYIVLTSGEINAEKFEPLYRIDCRALVIDYENYDRSDNMIDLSKLNKLEFLFTRSQLNCFNYANAISLKTLVVFNWNDIDLNELKHSKLDSLSIIKGKLQSLKAVDTLNSLKVLYLSYLRRLIDISSIEGCKSLLKMQIEKCSRAQLYELPSCKHLIYLFVSGGNRIRSLNHLKQLPNLKYLLLDGCYVEDGDVDVLRNIKHAVLFENRKCYSVRNEDLPKAIMPFVITDIPVWRQLLP